MDYITEFSFPLSEELLESLGINEDTAFETYYEDGRIRVLVLDDEELEDEFEDTGAVSRGYRTTPYPSVDLLHTLKENGGKVILSSDSHQAETLDYHFSETRALLKDIGFLYVYVLSNGSFVKDYL